MRTAARAEEQVPAEHVRRHLGRLRVPDRTARRHRPGHHPHQAEPQADGSYRISGTKIFITGGEQDLTENIIHLVLAKLPDAPAGSRGISLFLVPKFLVGDDGALGARNAVHCGSIEHKMGIRPRPPA